MKLHIDAVDCPQVDHVITIDSLLFIPDSSVDFVAVVVNY
jgi:hypothetical protein